MTVQTVAAGAATSSVSVIRTREVCTTPRVRSTLSSVASYFAIATA